MGSHFLEVHDVHSAHMVEMMGTHYDLFTSRGSQADRLDSFMLDYGYPTAKCL
jgi:hypothetical protein